MLGSHATATGAPHNVRLVAACQLGLKRKGEGGLKAVMAGAAAGAAAAPAPVVGAGGL